MYMHDIDLNMCNITLSYVATTIVNFLFSKHLYKPVFLNKKVILDNITLKLHIFMYLFICLFIYFVCVLMVPAIWLAIYMKETLDTNVMMGPRGVVASDSNFTTEINQLPLPLINPFNFRIRINVRTPAYLVLIIYTYATNILH